MIPAKGIKELLERRPFKPIRLFLSDGSSHDIPHPEFAWVFGGRVFIGIAIGGVAEAEGEVKELSILHLTRVEEATHRKTKK